jgi:hypothetical protein
MKRLVLFPFLFSLYVIFTPWVNNLDQLDPSQGLRPLAALLLGTAAAVLLLWVMFRDWHYAGFLVLLVLLFVFIPGHLGRLVLERLPLSQEIARSGLLVILGSGLALLGLRKTWVRLGGAARMTPRLNAIFALALLIQVFVALPRLSQLLAPLPEEPIENNLAVTGSPIELDCTSRPDIYYFILDGYGRADVLEEFYGLDNTSFIQYLESKGFFVAGASHTNYIQTIFSLSSALNFTYIGPEPPGASGREYFTEKIADNHLVDLLETCGYQTVTFDTGFSFTDNVEADVHLSKSGPLTGFESLLLAGTPLESLAAKLNQQPPDQSYEGHRSRVLFVFDQLRRLPRQPSPKFVFAHILSPHPPFVFDAQGKPVEPGRSYSIGDGNDYAGGLEEYRAGYAGQVQFVNEQLEKTVDAILARSSGPPVIIIQGDHGPGSHLDWGSPDRTCLLERTSILNAYYLPGAGEEELYASISPVNSFRTVLNEYFGTDLDRLPDKTFFTSQRLPRQVIDVTGERATTDHCSVPGS